MSDDIRPENLISSRGAFMPIIKKREPNIDIPVSRAVGKTILKTNPVLIRKIVEWKNLEKELDNLAKPGNPMQDNFLKDPKKVAELKAIL